MHRSFKNSSIRFRAASNTLQQSSAAPTLLRFVNDPLRFRLHTVQKSLRPLQTKPLVEVGEQIDVLLIDHGRELIDQLHSLRHASIHFLPRHTPLRIEHSAGWQVELASPELLRQAIHDEVVYYVLELRCLVCGFRGEGEGEISRENAKNHVFGQG